MISSFDGSPILAADFCGHIFADGTKNPQYARLIIVYFPVVRWLIPGS